MFNKVLIANRGEIAVRIARTLQPMGIKAVAVYSEPDRTAPHVALADEAYPLEGVTSAETYLRGERIIEIAKQCGAEAIHPGYGFLSENANFAEACQKAGLTFIGPTPDVIRAMGDKLMAKKTFAEAGVPVVPGWAPKGPITSDQLIREAKAIGYPVLIKAAAGGGGKGMRIVYGEQDLIASSEACSREAKSAFGDDRIFLEKYLEKPRHVEIQIFGDTHGNVVHLFERECSIQRRHQKIIEESPSPALTPGLRAEMGQAAVKVARTLGYTNAGTVEFLLDEDGSFYFLEVNTRLQVEHAVTEMIVRHDLVRAQLLVAAGERLPFLQEDLSLCGHAIEVRIYAEDAWQNYKPVTGTIARYVEPIGPDIRVDSGVRQNSEVTVHYDPMLSKLIAWGRTREEAIGRLKWALRRYVILGLTTNVGFLRRLISHSEFVAGRLHTHFLDENDVESPDTILPDEGIVAAAWACSKTTAGAGSSSGSSASAHKNDSTPWRSDDSWRVV